MDNQYKTYQVWKCKDGSLSMGPKENIDQLYSIKGFEPVELIHEFLAATGEEARAIYSLRMGYGTEQPTGKAELCPKCRKSFYYPKGCGDCPYCGNIC